MITPVAVWSQIMIPVWSEKHWQYNYFWSHCHWNNHFWSYWNYNFFHFILYRNNPDHIRIIISFTFIFWGLVKWAIGLRKLALESRPNMCRKIFQFMFRGFIFQLLFEYFFKIGLFTFLESLNSYSVYIFKYFNWCSIHIFKIFQFIFNSSFEIFHFIFNSYFHICLQFILNLWIFSKHFNLNVIHIFNILQFLYSICSISNAIHISKIFQFIFRSYIAQFSPEEASREMTHCHSAPKLRKFSQNFDERYEIKNNTKEEGIDKLP